MYSKDYLLDSESYIFLFPIIVGAWQQNWKAQEGKTTKHTSNWKDANTSQKDAKNKQKWSTNTERISQKSEEVPQKVPQTEKPNQ